MPQRKTLTTDCTSNTFIALMDKYQNDLSSRPHSSNQATSKYAAFSEELLYSKYIIINEMNQIIDYGTQHNFDSETLTRVIALLFRKKGMANFSEQTLQILWQTVDLAFDSDPTFDMPFISIMLEDAKDNKDVFLASQLRRMLQENDTQASDYQLWIKDYLQILQTFEQEIQATFLSYLDTEKNNPTFRKRKKLCESTLRAMIREKVNVIRLAYDW